MKLLKYWKEVIEKLKRAKHHGIGANIILKIFCLGCRLKT